MKFGAGLAIVNALSLFALFISFQYAWAIILGTLAWTLIILVYFGVYYYEYNCRVVKYKQRSENAKVLGKVPLTIDKVWSQGTRQKPMITMGSLFVPTAFALLALAGQTTTLCMVRIILAGLSPSLYVFWLFAIQLSTRLMNDVEAELMQHAPNPLGYYTRLQRELYGEKKMGNID